MGTPKDMATTETVFQAVRELCNRREAVTRERVQALTDYKLSIVDDRLGALVDAHRIVRLARNNYEVVPVWPAPRAISRTVLEDGVVKYEIGDEVLTLTPQEARRLGEASMGAAAAAVSILTNREYLLAMAQMDARMARFERDIRALKQKVSSPSPQAELPLTES